MCISGTTKKFRWIILDRKIDDIQIIDRSQIERQIDKQIQSVIGRQINLQINKQTDSQKDRQIDRNIDIDRKIDIYMVGKMDRYIDKQRYRLIYGWIDRLTSMSGQIDRQRERQK